MRTELASPGAGMDIDLTADLNAEDDDGLGWSTVADAHDPVRVRSGVMLLAGNRYGQAVVRIVAVDDDGQVHFAILPGSVEKNRHLLGRTVARARCQRPCQRSTDLSMPTATYESIRRMSRIGR